MYAGTPGVCHAGPPSKKNSSWRVHAIDAMSANKRPSQGPHAHTTASASSRAPSSSRARGPSGSARACSSVAPCASAWRASARVARWARSTPASGSTRMKASPAGSKLTEQADAGVRLEPLVRDALRGQLDRRLGLPAVLRAGEPAHTGLDHQILARLGLELAPQGAGAARGRRVVRVRAVPAADQARLAARGRRESPGANWSTSVTSLPCARATTRASRRKSPAPTITALPMARTLARPRSLAWRRVPAAVLLAARPPARPRARRRRGGDVRALRARRRRSRWSASATPPRRAACSSSGRSTGRRRAVTPSSPGCGGSPAGRRPAVARADGQS